MKLFKSFFLLGVFICFFFSNPTYASHLIGGDITYVCLGNNQFKITLTLYQDCLHGLSLAIRADSVSYYAIFTSGSNPQFVTSGSAAFISKTRIDPNFNNNCINNAPATCMQREVFVFTTTLPPSSVGYDIVYQRCCRNAAISNVVNPGNVGVTFMAHIPPFNNGECPNSSAVFNTVPPQIICINNPFAYDFSATDPNNQDSISYELCAAHPGGTTTNPQPTGFQITPPPYPSLNYIPPYSPTYPLSAVPPLQINPVTGIMTGTPNTLGRFVVTVCAHEWRNGTIISTVSRDVQYVVTNCSKAVVASMPALPDKPDVYKIECDGYTVHFINTSTGANINGSESPYFWDFGVPGATSTAFEPSYTYPDTGTYNVKLVINRNSTCPDSTTKLVKIYPLFNAGFYWAGFLCPGEPIQFLDTTIATFPPVVSWNWDFGDGGTSTAQNPIHTYAEPGGDMQVTLSSSSQLGCRDTITKTLPLAHFDLFAGNDTIIVLGYPFQLQASGSQFYKWLPVDYLSDPNIGNPDVDFPNTGHYTYVVTGSSEEGCIAQDTVNITVVKEGTIFVPNAFSPNGDGLNDFLKPIIVGFTRINSFQIFNRWGQKVFGTTNINNPEWDGTFNNKQEDVGTYFWVLKAINIYGETVTRQGDIIIIR